MSTKTTLKGKDDTIKHENKYIVLDLFCGCGGFSKGLSTAGLNIVAGIDIWNKAIETYGENNKHHALCKDLTQYTPEQFIQDTGIKNIDILVGGPPCQGFSIAGKRDNKDPRNSLFMEYVKYLKHFKPKAFIMENVVGILSMKTAENKNVIDIIMGELGKEYNCKYYKLSAADFEVPQIRKRTIFIGFRKDLNIIPTAPKTVSANNHIPTSTLLEKRENVNKKYFLSAKAITGINNKKTVMAEKGFGFGASYIDVTKPCYTIPARYWKDGYDALVKYSDTDIRRLTEKELAKVQTFPDDYVFKGTRKDIIMQIGNAVACRFAYHLGKYLIEKLNSINNKTTVPLDIKISDIKDIGEIEQKLSDENTPVKKKIVKSQKTKQISEDLDKINNQTNSEIKTEPASKQKKKIIVKGNKLTAEPKPEPSAGKQETNSVRKPSLTELIKSEQEAKSEEKKLPEPAKQKTKKTIIVKGDKSKPETKEELDDEAETEPEPVKQSAKPAPKSEPAPISNSANMQKVDTPVIIVVLSNVSNKQEKETKLINAPKVSAKQTTKAVNNTA